MQSVAPHPRYTSQGSVVERERESKKVVANCIENLILSDLGPGSLSLLHARCLLAGLVTRA